MIKAAIIDDGLTQNLSENWQISNWQISQDSIKRLTGIYNQYQQESHADICYKIIQHYLDANSRNNILWYNIKILDSFTVRGNIKSLLNAFQFCIDNNIRIIHLSIGTSYFTDFSVVSDAVEQLFASGIHIIAATNNRNTISYPACLPQVLGVNHSPDLPRGQFFVNHNPYDGVQFTASSNHNIDSKCNLNSNSFAAPLITSFALNYLSKHPNVSSNTLYRHLTSLAQPQENLDAQYGYIPRIICPPNDLLLFNHGTSISLENIRFPYHIEIININKQITIDTKFYLKNTSAEQFFLYIEQADDYLEEFIIGLLASVNEVIIVSSNSCVKQMVKTISRRYPYKLLLFEDFHHDFECKHQSDVPVVVICQPIKDQLLNILQYLKVRFAQLEYYCVTSADITLAKILGFDVIPKDMSLVDYVNQASYFFQCDILLVGISDNHRLDEIGDMDYLLVMDNSATKTDNLIWDSSKNYESLFQNLMKALK